MIMSQRESSIPDDYEDILNELIKVNESEHDELFRQENVNEIRFSIEPTSNSAEEKILKNLKKVIENCGGFLKFTARDEGKYTIRLVHKQTEKSNSKYDLFLSRYVLDCLKEIKLLDLRDYRASKTKFPKLDPNDVMLGIKSWEEADKEMNKSENVSDFSASDEDGPSKVKYTRTSRGNMFKNRSYTVEEERAILNYIISHKYYYKVKGNVVWQYMENEKISSRTWQSMKQRYLHHIVPRIKQFKLPSNEEKKLLHIFDEKKNGNTKNFETRYQNNIFKTKDNPTESSDPSSHNLQTTNHNKGPDSRHVDVKSIWPTSEEEDALFEEHNKTNNKNSSKTLHQIPHNSKIKSRAFAETQHFDVMDGSTANSSSEDEIFVENKALSNGNSKGSSLVVKHNDVQNCKEDKDERFQDEPSLTNSSEETDIFDETTLIKDTETGSHNMSIDRVEESGSGSDHIPLILKNNTVSSGKLPKTNTNSEDASFNTKNADLLNAMHDVKVVLTKLDHSDCQKNESKKNKRNLILPSSSKNEINQKKLRVDSDGNSYSSSDEEDFSYKSQRRKRPKRMNIQHKYNVSSDTESASSESVCINNKIKKKGASSLQEDVSFKRLESTEVEDESTSDEDSDSSVYLHRSQTKKYTLEDDIAILRYIYTKNYFYEVKGRAIWEEMEKRGILPGRSWQSLKERFRIRIFPRINSYKVLDNKVIQAFQNNVPSRNRSSKKSVLKYSEIEDLCILRYITKTKRYKEIKGKLLWVDMAHSPNFNVRTWESLKSRFLSSIITNLDNFSLTPKQRKGFEDALKVSDETAQKKSMMKYSLEEDYGILYFIIKNKRFKEIKGKSLWVTLSYEESLRERTWESLKNRFLHYIGPNLDKYKISESDKIRLRQALDAKKVRRLDKPPIFHREARRMTSPQKKAIIFTSEEESDHNGRDRKISDSNEDAIVESDISILSSEAVHPIKKTAPAYSNAKEDELSNNIERRVQRRKLHNVENFGGALYEKTPHANKSKSLFKVFKHKNTDSYKKNDLKSGESLNHKSGMEENPLPPIEEPIKPPSKVNNERIGNTSSSSSTTTEVEINNIPNETATEAENAGTHSNPIESATRTEKAKTENIPDENAAKAGNAETEDTTETGKADPNNESEAEENENPRENSEGKFSRTSGTEDKMSNEEDSATESPESQPKSKDCKILRSKLSRKGTSISDTDVNKFDKKLRLRSSSLSPNKMKKSSSTLSSRLRSRKIRSRLRM